MQDKCWATMTEVKLYEENKRLRETVSALTKGDFAPKPILKESPRLPASRNFKLPDVTELEKMFAEMEKKNN